MSSNVIEYRLDSLRTKQVVHEHLLTSRFPEEFTLHEDISKMIVDSVSVCRKVYKAGTECEFSKIYLFIASRLTSHSESVLILSKKALYIDIAVILRVMLTETAMLKYLYDKPALRKEWLSEDKSSYATPDYQRKFKDKEILKYVSKSWEGINHDIFLQFSKAAHASSYGSLAFDNKTSLYSAGLEENLENYVLALQASMDLILRATYMFIVFFTNLKTKIHGFEKLLTVYSELNTKHGELFKKRFGVLYQQYVGSK